MKYNWPKVTLYSSIIQAIQNTPINYFRTVYEL